MTAAVIEEVLSACREHLQAQLESEVENYSPFPGSSFEKMRRSLDAEGREIVEPLEALISRIDECLADNRGSGI